MKRTTITLPEEALSRLEREARRRHTSVSAVVRECIATKFPDLEESEGPRHVAFAGIFSDGGYPTAADMDDYLAKHWADDLTKDRA